MGSWPTGMPVELLTRHALSVIPGKTGFCSRRLTIRLITAGKTVTAKITGEVYAPEPPAAVGALLTSEQTFLDIGIHLPVTWYVAAMKAASQRTYEAPVQRALGPGCDVTVIGMGISTGSIHGLGSWALIDTPLVHEITIIIAILSGLGVLNTVLMLTRERVHDLGVFKAVGMTPRQAIIMVICWAIPPAIAAAVLGVPAGMAMQDAVVHATGGVQAMFIPGGQLLDLLKRGSLAGSVTRVRQYQPPPALAHRETDQRQPIGPDERVRLVFPALPVDPGVGEQPVLRISLCGPLLRLCAGLKSDVPHRG